MLSTDYGGSNIEVTAEDIKLYRLLQEGLNDISTGDTRPLSEAISEIKNRRK